MKQSERTHRVPALARAARVLDVLAAAGRPCSLAQLSVALDAPKSSVLGVCQALAEERLITRGLDGTYAPGPRLFELASVARTHGQPLRKVGFTYPQHEAFFLAERAQLETETAARDIDVDIRCADRSVVSQIDDIRAFIAKGVDLILVEPVMSEGLEEVLGAARAAQITVVAVGSSTSGADAVVATDNTKAGALAAILLARVLDRQGTVAVVDGIAITANADRISGFLGTMAEHPHISTLIAARSALNEDSGRLAAREILASDTEFDGIFAANDQIALGIAAVLAEQGKPVPIVSVDGAARAIEQIRAGGLIVGTATQDPRRLVEVALELGAALRAGVGRVQHAVFLPPRIVDRTNVGDYRTWE